MNENTFSLEQIYNRLIEADLIAESRRMTIKNSLKKYSQILGSEFSKCFPDLFIKPAAERNKLIESGLLRVKENKRNPGKLLSESAFRNVKNDVSFVLRNAIECGFIREKNAAPSPLKNKNRLIGANYYLPRQNEHVVSEKYILDPTPEPLLNELEEYARWATATFIKGRPRTLKRRKKSQDNAHDALLRLAGYIVKFHNVSAETITLETLTNPVHLTNYINWFMDARGKRTASVTSMCSFSQVLTKYLLKTTSKISNDKKELYESRLEEIQELLLELPEESAVVDKSIRWLSLKQIEAVGILYDPCSPERLATISLPAVARFQKHFAILKKGGSPPSYSNFKLHALNAEYSLILRLLVRIPMRQRNIREMAWNPQCPEEGKNLFRKEGRWYIKFRGEELKVSTRNGKENSVLYAFPADLSEELDRYLNLWRKLLAETEGADCKVPNFSEQELVFISTAGKPFVAEQIRMKIQRMTYKATGVMVYPHLIRSIWTTEYLKSEKNASVAAYMLNDTIHVIMTNYAELLDESCGDIASSWIIKNLSK